MSISAPSICVVTTRLTGDEANPTLIDDLVAELVEQGASVDVDVVDVETAHSGPRTAYRGATVFDHGPVRITETRLPRILLRLWWGGRGLISIRRRLRRRRYDLALYFGPAFLTLGTPGWIRRTGRCRRLVHVLWDFFPVHQVEIGRLPRGPQNELLRRLEAANMRHADAVVLMTRRNADFFGSYYPELTPEVLVHPPWGRPSLDDPRRPKPEGPFTVVFGGQLVQGRGVETLVEAVRILQGRRLDVEVKIVGDGPDRTRLEELARAVESITFLDRMPRREYLALLAGADCGVAVTVPGVSVPTFPSKTVDYTRMGLPVVAALETNSDAGALVQGSGAGLAVPAGDPQRLADALAQLHHERQSGTAGVRSAASRRLFEEHFDVGVVARALIREASGN